MRIGMLWFDDNKSRDLADKINRAAEHYEAKYAVRPTVCYVHPSMLNGYRAVGDIEVKGSNTVLPHHLWIGRYDDRKVVSEAERNEAEDNSKARLRPEQF